MCVLVLKCFFVSKQLGCIYVQTRYQTAGISHELSELLVKEMIQYSLNVADKPARLEIHFEVVGLEWATIQLISNSRELRE